jgi:hypothetical protein
MQLILLVLEIRRRACQRNAQGGPLASSAQGRLWHEPADFRAAAFPSAIGGPAEVLGVGAHAQAGSNAAIDRYFCTADIEF